MITLRHTALLVLVCVGLLFLGLELPRPGNDLVHLSVAPLAALGLFQIRGRRNEAILVWILGSAASALNLVFEGQTVPLFLDLLKVALWTLGPLYLAHRIFMTIYDADAITREEMLSAVTVYLLIGLVFANVYEALFLIEPDVLRFGDISPNHATTRIVAVAESVVGVMYMAILVARFVTLHTSGRFECS